MRDQIQAMTAAARHRSAELEQDADQHADDVRRRAASDSRRVLDCIDALERVTAEVLEALHREMDALHAEIVRCTAGAAPPEQPRGDEIPSATAIDAAPSADEAQEPPRGEAAEPDLVSEAEEDLVSEAEEVDAWEEEPAMEAEQWDHGPEPETTASAAREEGGPIEAEAEETDDDAALAPAAESTPGPARPRGRPAGLLSRLISLRRKGRPFIDTPGNCAVCRRQLHADSEEQLLESGWQIRGSTGVCPECQSAGWNLRENGTVPSETG